MPAKSKAAQVADRDRFALMLVKFDFDPHKALKAAGLDTCKAEQKNREKALRLEKDPQVQELVAKMQLKASERVLASMGQKRELLWDIAQETAKRAIFEKDGVAYERMVDPKTAVSAVAELNKMDGDIAAIKLQHQGDMRQTVIVKKFGSAVIEGEAEEVRDDEPGRLDSGAGGVLGCDAERERNDERERLPAS